MERCLSEGLSGKIGLWACWVIILLVWTDVEIQADRIWVEKAGWVTGCIVHSLCCDGLFMIVPLWIPTPMGYSVDSHAKANPVPRACSVRELHHSTRKELGQSPLYKTTDYRDKREGEGKPILSQNPKAWEGFLGSPVGGGRTSEDGRAIVWTGFPSE